MRTAVVLGWGGGWPLEQLSASAMPQGQSRLPALHGVKPASLVVELPPSLVHGQLARDVPQADNQAFAVSARRSSSRALTNNIAWLRNENVRTAS